MAKTKKKKKKLLKLKSLKKKLWKVFSEYIRVRDDYTCITCGQKNKGSGMHAGHFIPSKKGGVVLRYNDKNVNAQCYNCNINLGGYGAKYSYELRKKYGPTIDEALFSMIQPGTDFTREEYMLYIVNYNKALEDLKKEKNEKTN